MKPRPPIRAGWGFFIMAKPQKKPKRTPLTSQEKLRFGGAQGTAKRRSLTKTELAGAGIGSYLIAKSLRDEDKKAAFAGGFLDELMKVAKIKWLSLTPEERAEAKKRYAQAKISSASGDGCSPGKTKKGYEFHTHRATTGTYPRFSKVPVKKIQFVASTA